MTAATTTSVELRVEGETSDPAANALRYRQARNHLAVLISTSSYT